MRQIKFRAWGKYHGDNLMKIEDFAHLDKYNHFIGEDLTNNDYGNIFCVEQFIGKTDKNGVNIYEGDVISINDKHQKYIEYNEQRVGFCIINISDIKNKEWKDIEQFPAQDWWYEFKKDIEIIGNIHENPELLENSNG